jgi:hypothetical protein
MAIGSLVGGPVGAAIFNEVICKDATNLPMTIGAGFDRQHREAFNELMCNSTTCRDSGLFSADACRAAARQPTCLLDTVPRHAALGWLVLMVIGFASAAAMWLYDWWLGKQK